MFYDIRKHMLLRNEHSLCSTMHQHVHFAYGFNESATLEIPGKSKLNLWEDIC